MVMDSKSILGVWLTVHRTHDVLKDCEERVLSVFGFSQEQFLVLLAMETHVGVPRVTDVARLVGRSVNSVSMIVDRMVKANLVKRSRSREDRRTVYLKYANGVEDKFELALAAYKGLAIEAMAPLSPSDRLMLTSRLEGLQRAATKHASRMDS